MAKRLTEDGLAFYDEDLGVEIAGGATPTPFPTNFFRQLFEVIRWKITGRDPSDPLPEPRNSRDGRRD